MEAQHSGTGVFLGFSPEGKTGFILTAAHGFSAGDEPTS
jgi:hypothetical protein